MMAYWFIRQLLSTLLILLCSHWSSSPLVVIACTPILNTRRASQKRTRLRILFLFLILWTNRMSHQLNQPAVVFSLLSRNLPINIHRNHSL